MSPGLKLWLIDTGERAGTTLIEASIIYCITAQRIDDDFWKGFLVALIVTVVNVLKAAMTTWIPTPLDWRMDMLVRALWTFAIAMFGSLASVTWFDIIDLKFWQGVVAASGVAALAVLKALIARSRPDTITPASLVSAPGVAQEAAAA